ncbi:MAG: hypothetical protein ACPGYV_01300 [Phycisphaeraceae bacterium]
MDHINIPIPDGMDEEQKAELIRWLHYQVELATAGPQPGEDDPEWRAEAVRRVKRGLEDIKAGRVMTSAECRRQLDEKLGINRAG